MMFDYLRDPEAIYQRSFERVRTETALANLPAELIDVAVRLVHACAMPDIVAELAWSGAPVAAGRAALQHGAPILADCRMVAAGIRAPNPILCTLDDPAVPELARRCGATRTRSAAAVELWLAHLQDAVVAIGNAPTALYRLLELLLDGAPSPALILAFPVGFVGAAEAKDALIAAELGIPFLTLRGRRGGSALAAAAVNALA
jgi:precorrin isomerase